MNPQPVRLLVTGNEESGRSVVAFDGDAPGTILAPGRPVAMTDLWHMSKVPTDPRADGADPQQRPYTLAPLPEGLVFRVVQFDPMTDEQRARFTGREVFGAMNAADAHVGTSSNPFMHRTMTVDFGIVLEGTMTMLVDDGEVEISAGEILVQRATNHAWENRSGKRAVVAFILVDARESGGK
ncbi:MAG: cupin domain-containing protein [Mycetocola sp.]